MASPLKSQQLTGVAGIDASQLQAFGRALDKAAPELRIEMQRRLKAAAEVIKLDAMERASEHSTTIAHTIRLTSNRSAVTISAGGKGNVLARLYEIGNLEIIPLEQNIHHIKRRFTAYTIHKNKTKLVAHVLSKCQVYGIDPHDFVNCLTTSISKKDQ